MWFHLFLLIQLGLNRSWQTDAFVARDNCWQSARFDSTLAAKKVAKNKKSRAASSGGGFGATTVAPKKKDNDYSIFPALEQNVVDTLVPSVPVLFDESGELPDEIYQRLEQIYGFPNFNYAEKRSVDKEESSSSMSLDEMMSSSSSSSSSALDGLFGDSKPKTSLGTSDLDDLLSSATGGSSLSSKKTYPVQSTLDSLEQLPQFSKFRVLHIDPMVLAIDDFFTSEECDQYVAMSLNDGKDGEEVMQSRSPTVGKDKNAKSQRTSTTFYHPYKNVPELMAKASRLLGLRGITRWEEPQTVRYRKNEKFTWHLDALGPMELERGKGDGDAPGQRLATLLVYLTDLAEDEGGATMFRDLKGNSGIQREEPNTADESNKKDYLAVRPKKGSALLFFPAAGGIPDTPFDIRTLHCGQAVAEDASNDKWISQLWLRAKPYTPSAPPGNNHEDAADAIAKYCNQ